MESIDLHPLDLPPGAQTFFTVTAGAAHDHEIRIGAGVTRFGDEGVLFSVSQEGAPRLKLFLYPDSARSIITALQEALGEVPP